MTETAAEFGIQVPGAGHIATVNAHGLSVSIQYISGRLTIDIGGMEPQAPAPKPEPVPERALALVLSSGPPRSYGGRP
jgi:hypothetical protein